MSTVLISASDVKLQLRMNTAITEHDDFIEDLISDIIKEAETYLDYGLWPVSAQEVYLDGGTNILFLPHTNISNVTIWEDNSELDADQYAIYSDRGKIRKKKESIGLGAWLKDLASDPTEFMKGELIIRVQYDGGYTTLPSDLKRALIRQISYAFRRAKDLGLMAVTYPDGTISKFDIGEWLPEVERVLNRYRRTYV